MSKIRYEQTINTSHISHIHDGVNGVRLHYDVDLHSQPKTFDNVRMTKIKIIGDSGTIDYLEHGCGFTPIVRCLVDGKKVKIHINIDATTGTIAWRSDTYFTEGSNAHIVVYGMFSEYIVDDTVKDYSQYWCGYEWNANDSDPALTRITGEGMEDYFLRGGGDVLKGMLFEYVALNPVTKEEVVVPIDDPTEYENYRYGQHGDLFAKMKHQLYYRVERDGDIRRKKISIYPLEGFTPYHSNDYIVYIGLYEASCDNERTKIYSRVTPESEYETHIGGNKDGRFTEKLFNMPATDMNTQTFSNLAHSKGEGYDVMDYMTWLMLCDLFITEYGTRDCQSSVLSLDSNGYSRGGLGNGCTNVSYWANYNDYNPVVGLGSTDSLGKGSGEVLLKECVEGTLTPKNGVYANRFYGIENPFGHIFKLLTGIHAITKQAKDESGVYIDAFESFNIYVCDNPEMFFVNKNRDNANENEQESIGYLFEGTGATANGWTKDVTFGRFGGLIGNCVGASNKTYFCDYTYSNYGKGGYFSNLRWSAFGGNSTWNKECGLFAFHTHNTWASKNKYFGTRLCYFAKNTLK